MLIDWRAASATKSVHLDYTTWIILTPIRGHTCCTLDAPSWRGEFVHLLCFCLADTRETDAGVLTRSCSNKQPQARQDFFCPLAPFAR